MTNEMKMALWTTINAVRREAGQPDFDRGSIRYWWERFESEWEMERAHSRYQLAGKVWD